MKKLSEKMLIILLSAVLALGGLFIMRAEGFESTNAGILESEGIFSEVEDIINELDEGSDYDGFIIRLNDPDSAKKARSVSDALDAGLIRELEYSENTYIADNLEDIQVALGADQINTLEPDYLMELYGSVPDDPYYGGQYNLASMNVPAIWDYGLEGQDTDASVDMDENGDPLDDEIVIAVIDSGILPDHEDIDYDRILLGKNFAVSDTEDEQYLNDNQDHGTFVAGLISARKGNGKGIAGILQNVKILPLRSFGTKTGNTSHVIAAINYAVEQKELFDISHGTEGINICVINMSFGSSNSGAEGLLKEACGNAIEAGIILVCAAGNDGNAEPTYPAQYAMGVGAVDGGNNAASYSQRLSADNGEGYENKVWVAAPGSGIKSTGSASYAAYKTANGTSYSCPAVSALAALCKSIDNNMTQQRFMTLLKDTAAYKESSAGSINGQDIRYGWGLVDYKAAIDALFKEEELNMTETETAPDETSASARVSTPESENPSESPIPASAPTSENSSARPEKPQEYLSPQTSKESVTTGNNAPASGASGSTSQQTSASDLSASIRIFPDVNDPTKAYYKPVYWAAREGITVGYKDGNFGPADSCTRAQFVTFIWRMAGRPSAASGVSFSDVESSLPSYKAIHWAAEKGIIVGYKDGTFRPQKPVTRRQVAVMLWRWQSKPSASGSASFKDMDSSDSGFRAVQWGSKAGVIKGSKDAAGRQVFKPDDYCQRQQIVTFLYRLARDVHGMRI